MMHLYLVLHSCSNNEYTNDEIALATGERVLDSATAIDYIKQLEAQSNTIIKAFAKQRGKDKVWAAFLDLKFV
jgi:hypothetical protein